MITLTVTRSMPKRDKHTELDRLHRLDSHTVAAVYDRYFAEVFRYVRYRLGDETLAEDLASDVFVRLLEAVKDRRGPDRNLRGWLIGTAKHIVADHIRCHYRRPLDPFSESIPSDQPAPADVFEGKEQERLLLSTLFQLTDEQQHVLALRFGQGYSLDETAEIMNKKANAIKALQFRALAALQRKIGRAK